MQMHVKPSHVHHNHARLPQTSLQSCNLSNKHFRGGCAAGCTLVALGRPVRSVSSIAGRSFLINIQREHNRHGVQDHLHGGAGV